MSSQQRSSSNSSSNTLSRANWDGNSRDLLLLVTSMLEDLQSSGALSSAADVLKEEAEASGLFGSRSYSTIKNLDLHSVPKDRLLQLCSGRPILHSEPDAGEYASERRAATWASTYRSITRRAAVSIHGGSNNRPSPAVTSVLHSRKLQRIWSVLGHRAPAEAQPPPPTTEDESGHEQPSSSAAAAQQQQQPPVPVYCVHFACGSRVIVTGGDDYRLRVWNAKTGILNSTLAGHTGEVMEMVVNYCDTIIASSATDKTVRLWEVSDEDQQSRPLTALEFTAEVHFMAFTPSKNHEQVFITVTCDGGIFIWDLSTVTRDNGGEVLVGYCKYYLDVDNTLIRGFHVFPGLDNAIDEDTKRRPLNFWFAVGCSDKCVRVFSVQPHGERPVKSYPRVPELVKYHHLEFELSGVHNQVVSHVCFNNITGDCASSDDHGGLVLWKLASTDVYTRPNGKWIEAMRLSTPMHPLPEYVELIHPIIPTGDSLVRTIVNGKVSRSPLSQACSSVKGVWGQHAIRTFSWTADDRYIICGVAENPVEECRDETPTLPTEGREYRYGALVFETTSSILLDAVIHPSVVNGEVYVALAARFAYPWMFCLCSYDGGVTFWRIDPEEGVAKLINKFDLNCCHAQKGECITRQLCDGQFDGRGDLVVTDSIGCIHYFGTAQLASSNPLDAAPFEEQFFEGDYVAGVHCTRPDELLCDSRMRPYPRRSSGGFQSARPVPPRRRRRSAYLKGIPVTGEGYNAPMAQPTNDEDDDDVGNRWRSDASGGPIENGFVTPTAPRRNDGTHDTEVGAGGSDGGYEARMTTRSGRTILHRPYDDYGSEDGGDSSELDSDYRREGSRHTPSREMRRNRSTRRRRNRRHPHQQQQDTADEDVEVAPASSVNRSRRTLMRGPPSLHAVAFNGDAPSNALCELCHQSSQSALVTGQLLGPFVELSVDSTSTSSSPFPNLPLLRHSSSSLPIYIHTACLMASDDVKVELKDFSTQTTTTSTGARQQPLKQVLVIPDLKRILRRATRTICSVCGNSGATVTCAERCRGNSVHIGCVRLDESLKERQKMDKLIDGIYRCNACLPLDHPRSVIITDLKIKAYIDPTWRSMKSLRDWLLVIEHNPNVDMYIPQVGDYVRYFPPERPELLLTYDDIDPYFWCAGVSDKHAPVDCKVLASPLYLFPGEQDQRRVEAAVRKSVDLLDNGGFGNLIMVRLRMEVIPPHPAAGKRFTLHYRPSDGDADILVPIPRMRASLDYWRARPPMKGSQARLKYDDNFSAVEIIDYNDDQNEEEEVSILAAATSGNQLASEESEGAAATSSLWTVKVPGLMGWKNINVRDCPVDGDDDDDAIAPLTNNNITNTSSSSSSCSYDELPAAAAAEQEQSSTVVCAWELIPPEEDTLPFEEESSVKEEDDGTCEAVNQRSWRWPWCLTQEEEEVADRSNDDDPFLASIPCEYPTLSKARGDLILSWLDRLRAGPLPAGHWMLSTTGNSQALSPDAFQRVSLLVHESPFESADYPKDYIIDNAYPIWTGLISQRLKNRKYYRGVEPLQEDLKLLAYCHRYSPLEVKECVTCMVKGLMKLSSITEREINHKSNRPPLVGETNKEENEASFEPASSSSSSSSVNPPTRKRTLRTSSSSFMTREKKDSWVQCSKCNKWRKVVLSIYRKYVGDAAFECSNLEGVSCADAPDGVIGADNQMLTRDNLDTQWIQCDACSKWRIVDHSVYERFTNNPYLKFGCRANGRSCDEPSDDTVAGIGDQYDDDVDDNNNPDEPQSTTKRSRVGSKDATAAEEPRRIRIFSTRTSEDSSSRLNVKR